MVFSVEIPSHIKLPGRLWSSVLQWKYPLPLDLRPKNIFTADDPHQDNNDGNDQKNMDESVHGIGCDDS
jgi:hypothetical protein